MQSVVGTYVQQNEGLLNMKRHSATCIATLAAIATIASNAQAQTAAPAPAPAAAEVKPVVLAEAQACAMQRAAERDLGFGINPSVAEHCAPRAW